MFQENYIVDVRGHKIAVQIPFKTYQKLIEDAEELEDIKNYRKVKLRKSEPIPFEKAFKEIEASLK